MTALVRKVRAAFVAAAKLIVYPTRYQEKIIERLRETRPPNNGPP